MKEKFEFPEINIYAFAASDIVTISWAGEGDNDADDLDAIGPQ